MLSEQEKLKERYQLLQLLAQNTSQQTWSAIDEASHNDRVIIKLLAMSPEMGWEQAKRLEREGQVLGKLTHPQIPKYRDYFILDNLEGSRFPWFCLVQDQVPGKSLQQLLNEGYRFTESKIEAIAIEVLTILSYLHHFDPPVLHRDLKPSNLIRDEDGHIHVIDFGAVQDQATLDGITFTVVGTYGYVPMEQFGGRAVPASDLYSLGMTLIHLMTGVSPADLPQDNGRVQFATAVGVDRAFVNWVEKLTEPNVVDRLETADLALEAFHNRSNLTVPLRQRQPIGSKIKLQKSMSQLNLDISPRGGQGLSWSYSGAGLLMVFLNALKISDKWPWALLSTRNLAVLINLMLLISYVVLPAIKAFTQTVISLSRSHFTVAYKIMGFTYWKQNRTIEKVEIGSGASTGKSVVQIHINNKVFSTNPIAKIEQQWLIQEINDWLEIRADSQSS
jgi:serine/threonine protein kinase